MRSRYIHFAQLCCSILFSACMTAPNVLLQISDNIRLNQIGFYPSAPKIAIIRGAGSIPFYVISTANSDTAFHGMLTPEQIWPYSDESVSRADFSALRNTGRFTLAVPGVGSSHPFDIKPHVHKDLAAGAIKSYYYQRASTPLLSRYASIWARAGGHPDTSVLIHPSAATQQRPANTAICASEGWYDAGDYNKYIVNSGITTYTLLAAYEHFPDICAGLNLDIPESGNGIPDILNEALWNLRWMLRMQDPNDGGVYSEVTNTEFGGFIMPDKATTPRYVVMKTTSSALNFAAVTAQAARIAAGFKSILPGFSDSCLQASLRAWNWAKQNPYVSFDPRWINSNFSPQIHTGVYGDNDFSDEFAWAASELLVTTGQKEFLDGANPLSVSPASIPHWSGVRTLGLYTLAHHREKVAQYIDTGKVVSQLITLANTLCASLDRSAYSVVMGVDKGNFSWGGNGVAANQSMELLMAFQLTHDSSYLHAALSNLDYILGRNGTTYCFVTGFGSHPPLYIHHRISGADTVALPVPGLLVGGPNADMQDAHSATYQSSLPALAYTDEIKSYASNEICINWNAPLVYITIGLETLIPQDEK